MKKMEIRCDLVLAVAIIWVISNKESLQKQQDLNQKTWRFILHLVESVSFIQQHRTNGNDSLGRQAVNLVQSRFCLHRRTNTEEIKNAIVRRPASPGGFASNLGLISGFPPAQTNCTKWEKQPAFGFNHTKREMKDRDSDLCFIVKVYGHRGWR